MLRCIVKWYGIIDKITFWDSKIEWDDIFHCECSYPVLHNLGIVKKFTIVIQCHPIFMMAL